MTTQQAVFVSQEVIRCSLSIAGYLHISVSNDGATTSNETLLYRAFDSLCQTCDNVTSCQGRVGEHLHQIAAADRFQSSVRLSIVIMIVILKEMTLYCPMIDEEEGLHINIRCFIQIFPQV